MDTQIDSRSTSETGSAALQNPKSSFYDRVIKRLIDLVLALAGLVVLSPVFLIISIVIYIDDPGAVVFKQKRIGRDMKYFYIHKFRSMRIGVPDDTPTHLMKTPGKYLTRVGKFIRMYSLDELPQIWDIFVGNMSIIGPRPALWNQYDLAEERNRYGANSIRPGLTGWAQINGRDELSIAEKARYDGEYVQKESLWFDIKCFFMTIGSVIRHDGVACDGNDKEENDPQVEA